MHFPCNSPVAPIDGVEKDESIFLFNLFPCIYLSSNKCSIYLLLTSVLELIDSPLFVAQNHTVYNVRSMDI